MNFEQIEQVSNNKNEELKKIKIKNDIRNIKSKYIIKKIFLYFKKDKMLKITKYNKSLLKSLNITINDYKEYSETYSSIVIELIPAKSKFGAFINIDKYESEYYHMYFNDDKKEIKRNFILESDKTPKIRIIIDYQAKSLIELFCDCDCIETICFKQYSRNNITDMSSMFKNCTSLKEIDFLNINTTNVKYMSQMFYECKLLEKIDLSKFNLNKVIDMNEMFYGCSSLKDLNIPNFNANNVKNFQMFFDCPNELIEKINKNLETFKKY